MRSYDIPQICEPALHCRVNNPIIRKKNQPATTGADATVYVNTYLAEKLDICRCICSMTA